MNPRVTAIVPLYNKGAYVKRCLESILGQTFGGQTFGDLEVLVVDDGSTDSGPELVAAIGDPRVRLIRQANAGPGAARNRGAREARGELLAWLDADDAWKPAYLEESVRALDMAGPRAACVAWAMWEHPGPVSTAGRWNRLGIPEGRYQVSARTPARLVAAFLAHMLPSATVMRREVFLDAGGYYDKNRCVYAEDAYLWLNVLLKHPVVFRATPLVDKDCDAAELSTNLRGVRPVEPFLLDPEGIVGRCPAELLPLLRDVLALRACKTASVYGYFGDSRRARQLFHEFVRWSDWRMPWFFTALAGCTPAAKWLGAAARLAGVSLRESHA